jgi:hypothetical protein
MALDDTVGFTERTFRLKAMGPMVNGSMVYAWIFDDNGEVYQDRWFDTEREARDFMDNRGSVVKWSLTN